MTLWDPPGGGALSDSELDAMLARADEELLDHVRANTHPEDALVAMMAATDVDVAAPIAAETPAYSPAAVHVPGDHAVTVIAMRMRTRDIDKSLGHLLIQVESLRGFAAAAVQLNAALMDARAIGSTAIRKRYPPGRWRRLKWLALLIVLLDGALGYAGFATIGAPAPIALLGPACSAIILVVLVLALAINWGSVRFARLTYLVRTPIFLLATSAKRIDPHYKFRQEISELRYWVVELVDNAECRSGGDSEIRGLGFALEDAVDALGDSLSDLDRVLPIARSLLDDVMPHCNGQSTRGQLRFDYRRRRDIAANIAQLASQGVIAREKIESATEHLNRAKSLNPSRQLAAVEIDASGADLSAADVPDLELLEGVIWTDKTVWPPGTIEMIRAYSDEIRSGVYQVRRGNERIPILVTA